jgi:hypothetical protein
MKIYLLSAMIVASMSQAAFAAPVDTVAVQKARQIRLDIEAKQKQLAEEKRAEAPAPAAPAAPLELTVDEADSPGATRK